jgi:hypothetical protein
VVGDTVVEGVLARRCNSVICLMRLCIRAGGATHANIPAQAPTRRDLHARRIDRREPLDALVNTVVVEHADRRFQVWAYSVSMARLLLRSTKSETFTTRLDVLFQNVKAMKLPTGLDGLVVAQADTPEEARISAETGLLPSEDTKIFTVRAGAFDGYVVAGVCVAAEDQGEYFEPSRLWQEPA